MAGIEIAQIPASIEYASLKHNEDMHSSLVQSHVGVEAEKKNDLSHSQVSDAGRNERHQTSNPRIPPRKPVTCNLIPKP